VKQSRLPHRVVQRMGPFHVCFTVFAFQNSDAEMAGVKGTVRVKMRAPRSTLGLHWDYIGIWHLISSFVQHRQPRMRPARHSFPAEIFSICGDEIFVRAGILRCICDPSSILPCAPHRGFVVVLPDVAGAWNAARCGGCDVPINAFSVLS
jgi:hypothetical protein